MGHDFNMDSCRLIPPPPQTLTCQRWKAPNRLVELLNMGFATDLVSIAATEAARNTAETAARLTQRFRTQRDGMYLHIADSPFDLCRDVLMDTSPEHQQSALAAIAHLQTQRSLPVDYRAATQAGERASSLLELLARQSRGDVEHEWETRAESNASVATTLSSLDEQVVIDLMHHGYVLAMSHSVLNLDWPVLDEAFVTRDRFEQILKAQGSAREPDVD